MANSNECSELRKAGASVAAATALELLLLSTITPAAVAYLSVC